MAVGSRPGDARSVRSDRAVEPIVRIEGLTKSFGDVEAVAGIDLEIFPGEFFALLGASGCGKTTLLRLLAGFEAADSGRIVIAGKDMARVPAYDRPVNMMFQSYALFPHMSVGQNIAFGLKQEGMPRAEIAERVGEMLDLVQIRPLAARKPHQLSGGQRQRVALARALAKRPKLVLLDEPLAALDRKLRERTQFELVNIQERLGMTFVIVTHDQEEAMTMASRVCVMDAGRIMQVDTPSRVYEYPNSRFVADFLGTANIFAGTVAGRDDGELHVRCGDLGEVVRVADKRDIPTGRDVAVMVRPEKVRTAGADDNPGFNFGRGVVKEIAYLGDLSIYHVELASGKRVQLSRANVLHTAEAPITWDDEVGFHWHPANAVLLEQ